MGRLLNKVADAHESIRQAPVECPRGWGQVVFLPVNGGLLPLSFVKGD